MARDGHSLLGRRAIVIAAVLALSLAACGRRGALDARQAADPAATATERGAPGAPSDEARPPAKPQRSFLLDAII